MKVSQIKGKITTNYKIEIYDAKGNLLTDEQNAGTGSKIKFIDESGNVKIGEKAPDFNAVSTFGNISLKDYEGKRLVLFSHPGDFTPVIY